MCVRTVCVQAVNAGKSLFLLYALKSSPRLTLLYLYLFDYLDSFLPFLHTCCPTLSHNSQPMDDSLNKQVPVSSLHCAWQVTLRCLVNTDRSLTMTTELLLELYTSDPQSAAVLSMCTIGLSLFKATAKLIKLKCDVDSNGI